MSASKSTLTADELRELLDYDPETGMFTRRQRPGDSRHIKMWNAQHAGKVAGGVTGDGLYWQLSVSGRLYRAHRLAWLYVTGKWPDGEIDHIDHNGLNNRFANLRVATRSENARNALIRRTNALQATGIVKVPSGNYAARIVVDGSVIYLGTFRTLELAKQTRKKAEQKYFGDFAPTHAHSSSSPLTAGRGESQLR